MEFYKTIQYLLVMIIKKKLNIIIKSLFLYLVFFTNVSADQDFNLWLKKFQNTAIESGISIKVVNEIMSKNPEAVARIRAGIEAGIQSGELDANELNTIIQLAKTVMQNPEMYPQIRQMAIQRGIATEADLPAQFDEGLVIAIIAAGKSMEADVQIEGGQAPMPQPPVQEMEFGGMVNGPSHDQGGVRVKMKGGGEIEVEGGEYVIPKDVVKKKGTDFFDKMLQAEKDKA